MSNVKKVTKRDNFEEVIKIATELGRTDLVEFAQHEIELLDKKANSKVATKTQKENEGLKENILEFLRDNSNEMFTITQLQEKVVELEGLSNQKVSALVAQMVKTEEVKRITDKKKSYFQIAE